MNLRCLHRVAVLYIVYPLGDGFLRGQRSMAMGYCWVRRVDWRQPWKAPPGEESKPRLSRFHLSKSRIFAGTPGGDSYCPPQARMRPVQPDPPPGARGGGTFPPLCAGSAERRAKWKSSTLPDGQLVLWGIAEHTVDRWAVNRYPRDWKRVLGLPLGLRAGGVAAEGAAVREKT